MKTATAVISRRALRHNLQRIRQLAPGSQVVAVVKANAYGHGMIESARTFCDADCYGVARLSKHWRFARQVSPNPLSCWKAFSPLTISRFWWNTS